MKLMRDRMVDVSIVIPVYNEETNVQILHNELKQVKE